MRPRDPRRLLTRRRAPARARVRIVEERELGAQADGSVTTRQSAEVTLPRAELDRLWAPEYLERLARTYWRYLSRISLGLLRVSYRPDARELVLIGRPLVLLRFRAPEYELSPRRGSVTWRIADGLLVAPSGRGKGMLRIEVTRLDSETNAAGPAADPDADASARISSEVASFQPLIAAPAKSRVPWLARLGRWLYRQTQLRIHVLVTHGFLRSLAALDLAPSVVGALLPPAAANGEGPSPTASLSPGARR